MATFKIWHTDNAYKAIWYATQPKKTMDENRRQNITSINMTFPPAQKYAGDRKYRFPAAEAASEFQKTKDRYHKTGERQAYHAEQSFYPGEVTPERAHEIGVEFAKQAWPDFEVVVATHVDQKHIHNHFVINSVSCMDGRKYRDDIKGEEYRRLRSLNDDCCRRAGLSVIENPASGRHKNYRTWQREQGEEGATTVRAWIREDIDRILPTVNSLSALYDRLREAGYQVDTSGKYVKVRPKGKDGFFRLHKLDKQGNYAEEKLYDRIQEIISYGYQAPKSAFQQSFVYCRVRTAVYLTRRMNGLYGHCLFGTYLAYRHLAKMQKQKKAHTVFPSMFLRETARDLQRFTDKTRLLCTEHIHTQDDLAAYGEGLASRKTALVEDRQKLRIQLRQDPQVENADAVRLEIENLTQEIKKISYEIRLCEEIEAEAQSVEQEVQEAEQELTAGQERENQSEERKE